MEEKDLDRLAELLAGITVEDLVTLSDEELEQLDEILTKLED